MCEYEFEGVRSKIIGTLCTLTGRGCFIENELDKPRCDRRLWAIQYQTKGASPEGPASPDPAQANLL